jgi:hypothetical protein
LENYDYLIDILNQEPENQEYCPFSIIYLCSLYSKQLELDEAFFDFILVKFKEWDPNQRRVCSSHLLWKFFGNIQQSRIEVSHH